MLAAALAGTSLLLTAAPPVSADSSVGAVTGVSVSGRGLGHGVGLSQWGAYERALAGQTHQEILSFYYPGATISRAPGTNVRVLLADETRLTIGSNGAFTVTGANGRTLVVAPGSYPIGPELRLGREQLALPVTVAPGCELLMLDGGRYRGTFTLALHDGRLQVVNTLDLELYVGDVVSYENPGYWPREALRSQAIASRSYALANRHPRANFDLYPDDRSQNYAGLRKEYPRAVAATAATRGQVLRYSGELVDAFFSASNGGLTRDAADAFGGPRLPYFASRPDPFDAMSPESAWGPVVASIPALRRAFPQLPAVVVQISVTTHAAGRTGSIRFEGAGGSSVQIDGAAFEQRLGLRSPYFSLTPTY